MKRILEIIRYAFFVDKNWLIIFFIDNFWKID
nr:MAG TPA: hypothetical protein [Caudoviricetes sp.]